MKQVEELKNEIEDLKIRIRRLEAFVLAMPNGADFINDTNTEDSLFEEAKILIQQVDLASASLLQRRLSIGYSRAARLLDQLEEKGLVGKAEGGQPRKVIKK